MFSLLLIILYICVFGWIKLIRKTDINIYFVDTHILLDSGVKSC